MSDPSNHLGLLLVDFQDVFLKTIPDRERLLQRTGFALQSAELLDVAVAATEQMPEKLGGTTESITTLWNPDTPVFDKSASPRSRPMVCTAGSKPIRSIIC